MNMANVVEAHRLLGQEPFVHETLGWAEHRDTLSGKPYYYNPASGSTTWEKPLGAAPALIRGPWETRMCNSEHDLALIDDPYGQERRCDGCGARINSEETRWRCKKEQEVPPHLKYSKPRCEYDLCLSCRPAPHALTAEDFAAARDQERAHHCCRFDRADTCRFFGSEKGCNYLSGCTYAHDDPNSVAMCTFGHVHCLRQKACSYRHRTWSSAHEAWAFYSRRAHQSDVDEAESMYRRVHGSKQAPELRIPTNDQGSAIEATYGVGHALVAELGWQPGRGLGRDGSGMAEPLATSAADRRVPYAGIGSGIGALGLPSAAAARGVQPAPRSSLPPPPAFIGAKRTREEYDASDDDDDEEEEYKGPCMGNCRVCDDICYDVDDETGGVRCEGCDEVWCGDCRAKGQGVCICNGCDAQRCTECCRNCNDYECHDDWSDDCSDCSDYN